MVEFRIQETTLAARLDVRPEEGLQIQSVPYPYRVEFTGAGQIAASLAKLLAEKRESFVLIDRRIHELYFAQTDVLKDVPTLIVDAAEQTKTIYSAIAAAEFLEDHRASKQGMFFVVGGGIVQDIGACAAALYKRGMPWTFVPTTLLAQSDSCVGGKTGLNHRQAKNLMALFSAPRKVLIDIGFLPTLTQDDQLSGLGEAFRLCVTGGEAFLASFEREVDAWFAGDAQAMERIICQSLSVKRAVVEHDEFEIDLRRSMNYGHSLGHAIESLVDFRIPHGVGVSIGMLIENEISHRRGLLPDAERQRMLAIGRRLIPAAAKRELAQLPLDGMIDLLRRDKKTLGSTLKLVVVERIGQIRFIDLALDADASALIKQSIDDLLQVL